MGHGDVSATVMLVFGENSPATLCLPGPPTSSIHSQEGALVRANSRDSDSVTSVLTLLSGGGERPPLLWKPLINDN